MRKDIYTGDSEETFASLFCSSIHLDHCETLKGTNCQSLLLLLVVSVVVSWLSSKSRLGNSPSVANGTTSTPRSKSFSVKGSLRLKDSSMKEPGPARMTRRAIPLNELTGMVFFSSMRTLRFERLSSLASLASCAFLALFSLV
uniref:Uncharacterized protein n=1 Tax=Opuntia streptacantha TaxID=393608 RepID=A0A7C9A8K9_OPUST